MTSSYNTDGIEALQELIGPDYRLQWIIGHGGMSTVWLADDVRNAREVAIKVLRPEFSDNQEFLSRFRNEATTAESIQHPNVVATYDYRELVDDRGRNFCFIVMEFVRGESLADLIAREGKLPEERALNLLEQAAHGLGTIHAMHLVHRDIKPGNIMITPEDRVKITDFGIAKAAAAVPLTRTGMVVGTAQYVSPEQAQGHNVTAASDIYSLGVVGYELLSGARPFSGDSSVSVAISHIKDAAPPLDTTVSAPARELIAVALRKDATRRFPEGSAFAAAISQVRLGQPPRDPSPQPVAETTPYAPTNAQTTVMPVGTPAEVLQQAAPTGVPSSHLPGAVGTAGAAGAAKTQQGGKGGWIAAGLLLAMLIGGGGAWALRTMSNDPQPSPAPATSSVAPATTAPTTSLAPKTSKSTSPQETVTQSVPQATTIYETTEPSSEAPSSQSKATKTKETKTKESKPKTTEPQVSISEAPLPSQTVDLGIPNLGTMPNNVQNN
ncbi:protein kinase [Corynebacterium sp. H128]|uniref:serine/threonine-protein kinase n=1 Tax=Corynebacterium sp. H128 TaxID=3133427 RepID=UPI0030A18E37